VVDVNKRLPFADGRANPVGTSNGAVIGFIPWLTIGLSASDATDPWGNPIRYLVDVGLAAPGISQSLPPSPSSYTLMSDGPDGTAANADDQTLTLDINSLRGSLVSAGVVLIP